MSIAIAAAVFPVIFLAELPDKTMVASLVLASRGRGGSVWLGGAAAFGVHVVIAATVGVAVARLLPQRGVGATVAAMFLAGAALSGWDAWRTHAARALERAPQAPAGRLGTMATAFGVVFAAEWGDLTQILTASLAAHYHSPLSVAAGALLALWSVAAIAVTGGQRLGRLIHPVIIRAATAALLAGLAAYTAWATLS